MLTLLRQLFLKNNQYSALISYISLCVGVIFYYLTVILQVFRTLYTEQNGFYEVTYAFFKVVNFALLAYVIILAPVYYYYLKTRIHFFYRVLLYFILPCFITSVIWYFRLYSLSPKSYNSPELSLAFVEHIIFFCYIQGLSIVMTVPAIMTDCVLSILRKVIALIYGAFSSK